MQEAQASSERSPHRKIDVTSKPPVGGISVVTLIRTDTTLDHSQKAEKVWRGQLANAQTEEIRVSTCSIVAGSRRRGEFGRHSRERPRSAVPAAVVFRNV